MIRSPYALLSVLALVSTADSLRPQSTASRALDRAFVRKALDAHAFTGALDRRKAHANQKLDRLRARAVEAAVGAHDEATLHALVRACCTLDAELFGLRQKRAVVFRTESMDEYAAIRAEVDRGFSLQGQLHTLLEAMPSTHANAFFAELARLSRAPDAPFSLLLLLAKRSEGLTRIDSLKRQLTRPLEPAAVISYLRVLAGLGPRARLFREWLEARAQAASVTVRIEALRALRQVCSEASIPFLMKRLRIESARRLRRLVADALEATTGERFGTKLPAWERWWQRRAGDRKGGGANEALTQAIEQEPTTDAGTAFFGIEHEGHTVLYILDKSQSMKARLPTRKTRLDTAKREVTTALEALGDRIRVQLVVFSSIVHFWQKWSWVTLDRASLRDAKRWLKKVRPGGATGSYLALEESLHFAGARGVDRFDEIDVDTIYFVSDGQPGSLADRMLSTVRRLNPIGRVVIHTIAIGDMPRSARVFMRDLARQNGGKSVLVVE